MRIVARWWGLACVVAALACGADEPMGESCLREEGGVATQSPCPTNYACVLLATSLQRACVPRCRFNSDCTLTQCCKALTGTGGGSSSYGGCIAPSNGDRSVCTGPTTTTPSFPGRYVGTYNVTRTSDLPPREGNVSEVSGYSVSLARASETVVEVNIDPGCALEASVGTTQASIFSGDTCTSRTLLPGATLTVVSGSGTLSGNRLTLSVELRYVTSDGSDRGTLAWGYTGARQ
jgi:hypothetical protein